MITMCLLWPLDINLYDRLSVVSWSIQQCRKSDTTEPLALGSVKNGEMSSIIVCRWN